MKHDTVLRDSKNSLVIVQLCIVSFTSVKAFSVASCRSMLVTSRAQSMTMESDSDPIQQTQPCDLSIDIKCHVTYYPGSVKVKPMAGK